MIGGQKLDLKVSETEVLNLNHSWYCENPCDEANSLSWYEAFHEIQVRGQG